MPVVISLLNSYSGLAADNCLMMFGDGKKAMSELVTALKEG